MKPSPMTLGATPLGDGRTRFRVWAPRRTSVEVCLERRPKNAPTPELTFVPLERMANGYFEGHAEALPGMRYRYRLDRGDCYPDPCSRFQPEGPHGPSEIVDMSTFSWSDSEWTGRPAKGQVLYELHVGAFTPEGTYAAASAKLGHLKELGVTTVELMPLNTFPGRFNWGYDGVDLFGPCAVYGRPDDLRRFIDDAHRLGLGVILDVVYNHLGPDGNYLAQFAREYFTDKYPPEWGDPPDFESEHAGPVRDFFIQNAAHWIAEYHFDGLRIDATQSLYDHSGRHIVADLVSAAREAAGGRHVLLIAENEPQGLYCITPQERGGFGADALWVDDFHHAARVALTGRAEAYLQDYRGTAQELLSCALRNSLFQGQFYEWQDKPRGGALLHSPAHQIVFFLENHDQLANTLRGERLHRTGGLARTSAMTTFWLLLPQTPMLFMGQEFFASTPFLFFVDHNAELQAKVNEGRKKYLSQFKSAAHALEAEGFEPASGAEAFERSRLDWSERDAHRESLELTRALLHLRRDDPVFSQQDGRRLAGATLSEHCLVLRFFGDERAGDRLLILNLGAELCVSPCPEPLLAPIPGRAWRPLLSSEETRFGGCGARFPGERWRIQGQSAVVMMSEGPA